MEANGHLLAHIMQLQQTGYYTFSTVLKREPIINDNSYRCSYSFYTNKNENTTLRRPTIYIHLLVKIKNKKKVHNSRTAAFSAKRPKLTGTYSCGVTRQNTRKLNRASGQYECTKILWTCNQRKIVSKPTVVRIC